mmetsp:Transcript_68340/g.79567  ORF Transcript_68340/g.79567 Transcript_68340/m.79567 type:complete len:205 (+) Transcript_68340:582-1196(+)
MCRAVDGVIASPDVGKIDISTRPNAPLSSPSSSAPCADGTSRITSFVPWIFVYQYPTARIIAPRMFPTAARNSSDHACRWKNSSQFSSVATVNRYWFAIACSNPTATNSATGNTHPRIFPVVDFDAYPISAAKHTHMFAPIPRSSAWYSGSSAFLCASEHSTVPASFSVVSNPFTPAPQNATPVMMHPRKFAKKINTTSYAHSQ